MRRLRTAQVDDECSAAAAGLKVPPETDEPSLYNGDWLRARRSLRTVGLSPAAAVCGQLAVQHADDKRCPPLVHDPSPRAHPTSYYGPVRVQGQVSLLMPVGICLAGCSKRRVFLATGGSLAVHPRRADCVPATCSALCAQFFGGAAAASGWQLLALCYALPCRYSSIMGSVSDCRRCEAFGAQYGFRFAPRGSAGAVPVQPADCRSVRSWVDRPVQQRGHASQFGHGD